MKNNTRRIVSIVGARPQFIKAAVFCAAVDSFNRTHGDSLDEVLIHTGQHYDYNMNESFFEQLPVRAPYVNLAIAGGSHGAMTGRMLEKLEAAMIDLEPDMVVVFGDTNSTLAGALAAAKLNIPVSHVEAGLRHYRMDIPEEVNRRLTDHVSALMFCSSEISAENLRREGITRGVHVVGDITYDIFKLMAASAKSGPYQEAPYAVSTIHRAANTDDPKRLGQIIEALAHSPCDIVLPLHPRTRVAMERNALKFPTCVKVIDPVSYLEMIGMLRLASFVITDSGGMQKDAYFCNKRCITMSEVSPWQELIDLDANRLVGVEVDEIVRAFSWALAPLDSHQPNPYGDGTSANKSVSRIAEFLGLA